MSCHVLGRANSHFVYAALKPTDPEEPLMQDLPSLQCRVLMTVATFGKGVGTRNIMKHLETNSAEHLYLVLDLPLSFVTIAI